MCSKAVNDLNQLFKKPLLLQEEALKLINFQLQTKESKLLNMSDFISYKYALQVRNFLRKENLQIFNDMFAPLDLNHTYSTCTATNQLFDIPQRQTILYGTYIISLK